MFHRPRARTALAALVTAASAVALVSPAAAAAPAHDHRHGHHHSHHVAWHHVTGHHVRHRTHHRMAHLRLSRGLPTAPFMLRNKATGSCLMAEDHGRYNVYTLAECARHDRNALWIIDRASGTLRNMATERCVVPGYAEDFSCARLAEYGRGFAVHRDAAGRIYYRAITGKRYLNLTRRMSGGYVFGATYTMEPKHSPMGLEQRWTAKVA